LAREKLSASNKSVLSIIAVNELRYGVVLIDGLGKPTRLLAKFETSCCSLQYIIARRQEML
jgi:hypothetical protein